MNYDTKSQNIYFRRGDRRLAVKPWDLRVKCECALCYSETTGEKLFKDKDVSQDVHPTSLSQKGNYAVAITWSDGHNSSIYPYKKIWRLFGEGEIIKEKKKKI